MKFRISFFKNDTKESRENPLRVIEKEYKGWPQAQAVATRIANSKRNKNLDTGNYYNMWIVEAI